MKQIALCLLLFLIAACSPTSTPCTTASDCASTETCTNQKCVNNQCSTQADCATGQICSKGACIIEDACKADADCPLAKECKSGKCEACPNPCTEGQKQCDGDKIQTCEKVRECTRWGEAKSCEGEHKTCQNGACACKNECFTNSAECANESAVKVCTTNSEGCRYWLSPTPCDAGETCKFNRCQ